jgi:hypothetical protein
LRQKETQPSSATPQRMGLWYLHDHDAQPVRISYLHLPQPPRLVSRELDNIHSSLFQLVSYGVDVSHLQPQTYTLAGPVREEPDSSRKPPPRKKTTPLVDPLPHSL